MINNKFNNNFKSNIILRVTQNRLVALIYKDYLFFVFGNINCAKNVWLLLFKKKKNTKYKQTDRNRLNCIMSSHKLCFAYLAPHSCVYELNLTFQTTQLSR